MRCFSQTVVNMAVGIFATGVLALNASAETLNLNCAGTGGSSAFRLALDPTIDLVSNEGSLSGRRWAARANDKSITWDEVYDSYGGHIANHFALDRTTGTLRATDMTNGGEVLSAVCQKS